MRDEDIVDCLISIVKEDSNLAMGCTEPVAIAYCAHTAADYINKNQIESVEIELSKSVFKNAKSVKIPGTGRAGIEYAVILGILVDTIDSPLLIFDRVNSEVIGNANEVINNLKVSVKIKKDVPDIYVSCKINADKGSIAILSNSHDHIEKVILNGETLHNNPYSISDSDECNDFDIRNLTIKELAKISNEIDYKKIKFTLDGIDVNMKAYEEGIKGYGLGIGKKLLELENDNINNLTLENKVRIMTAAAADMRMGGGKYPIMTSGGSGNQGLGVILTIYLTAEEEGVSEERLSRALFFAHCLNRYIKGFSGKLSGMCGCGIASSVSAAAAIVYMLDGTYRQIAGACSNVYGNLTGLICDGAKESCSLKLSTSSVEAVISAYLALNNIILYDEIGVLGATVEETIINIGKLSNKSFASVDEDLIDII